MDGELILKSTRKLALLSLMVSQALILSIIESWIPVTAITLVPGIKLGLANIITVIVIVFFGSKEAFLVVFVRCALASMFGGGLIVFLFSVTGGLLSTAVMVFLYKKASNVFSLTGVSVAGAVAHNLGQIIIASFIMKTSAVLVNLPMLLIAAIVMGCFIGLCSNSLAGALRKTNIFRNG